MQASGSGIRTKFKRYWFFPFNGYLYPKTYFMILQTAFSLLAASILIACNNATSPTYNNNNNNIAASGNAANVDNNTKAEFAARHFRGALTGGMKGDSIFFDVSADDTKLENLTFKGYWRCDGKLEMLRAAGPEGYFTLVDNKVNDHVSEPPDGGATAWRFDLSASIEGNKASGTFRMNINNPGCNTGRLQWTAQAY